VQACGVANINRVEDMLHLATWKQPTSSSITYELSPRRHCHHHQVATIIYLFSLRRLSHLLSSWYQISTVYLVSIHKSIPAIPLCFQSYPEKASKKLGLLVLP
jgi:hypothetical protein